MGENGHLTCRGPLPALSAPPSAQRILEDRIRELGQVERDVLDVAACIGTDFDAHLIAMVLSIEKLPVLRILVNSNGSMDWFVPTARAFNGTTNRRSRSCMSRCPSPSGRNTIQGSPLRSQQAQSMSVSRAASMVRRHI